MKKLIYISAFLVFFVTFGCNQKEKQEIAKLSIENRALKVQAHVKDSSINDILQSLNQIESNLAVIKEKEAVISVKSSGKEEMSPEVRVRINEDIKVINELMSKNKNEIARLHKLLKGSNLKIEEFEKMISQLKQEMTEKDNQLTLLKENLTKLNFSVATLNASLDTLRTEKTQLNATIADKINSLNTAYYVAGNKKQLLTDNIISKEGGFAGIGRSNKLKEDFNESKFQKVDIRQLDEIPVNSKKIQLVTTHPKGSYQIESNTNGMIDKIKITNPEKFWSASKYLVILVN